MSSMWRAIRRILVDLLQAWLRADGFGQAAALSFYAMFSLAPILVFSLLLASHFLGRESARAGAERWLEGFVSADEARDLIGQVHIDNWEGQAWWVTVFLVVMFLWASSLSFVRLRVSVNRLLDCNSDSMKQAVKNSLIGRLHAVAMSLGAGVIMVAGIWLVTLLGSLTPFFAGQAGLILWLTIRASALVIIALSSLLVFRVLPLTPPSWKGTFWGLGFLLVAFELGRFLLNVYLAHSWITAAYGAANTLVVFLLWIYYTAQALLLAVTLAGVLSPSKSSQNR